MTITADDVRATRWTTLQHTDFERGGWGRLQESLDYPELQLKTWRPSRHEDTRGALLVRRQPLGVFRLAAGDFSFPADVYQWAAELLSQAPGAEKAA